VRVVGYTPDPDTGQVLRDSEGEWRDKPREIDHAALAAWDG